MHFIIRFLLVLMMISPVLQAGSSSWFTKKENNHLVLNVELFLSSTCDFCHKEDEFFRTLEAETPWLHVQRHSINEDKTALVLFNQLLTQQNMDDFKVPSVFFCDSRWVGFASPQTTGKELLAALDYCKKSIETAGYLPESTINVLRHRALGSRIEVKLNDNAANQKILLIALIDAFNPCSLFGLIGFLGVLCLQNSRKTQLTAGLIFIATTGIMHYFQQSYAGIYFGILPWLRIPALVSGIFLIYLIRSNSKRPGNMLIYSGALLLPLMPGFYQQTCLLNWSYVFVQWLNNQQFSAIQHALYQLYYYSLYLLPLILVLFIYFLLTGIKRFRGIGKAFDRIGLLYILILGLMLIVYPQALSSLILSYIILVVVPVGVWFYRKRLE